MTQPTLLLALRRANYSATAAGIYHASPLARQWLTWSHDYPVAARSTKLSSVYLRVEVLSVLMISTFAGIVWTYSRRTQRV